ncbi:DUF4190 domain-containing protein [Mycolicibacterium sp. XJ662]
MGDPFRNPGAGLPPSKYGAGYTVGDGATEPPATYGYPAQYPHQTPEPSAAVHYPPPPGQYPEMVMPVAYMPVAKTNGMSIAALVCSLVFAPLGIIFGHIALSQIKRTGEDGKGFAIAGLVIGYIFTALLVVYIVVVVIFLGALGSAINDSTYYDSTYYSMALAAFPTPS